MSKIDKITLGLSIIWVLSLIFALANGLGITSYVQTRGNYFFVINYANSMADYYTTSALWLMAFAELVVAGILIFRVGRFLTRVLT